MATTEQRRWRVAYFLVIVLVIVVALVVLTSCSSEPEVAPVPKMTDVATVTISSTGREYVPHDPPAPSAEGQIQWLALELSWEQFPRSQRRQICEGWNRLGMREYLVDVFMDETEEQWDRDNVYAFFDLKCDG